MDFNLFISLFPASQAGPVVVPETQKIIIGHQPFNGVPDHIYVDWLPLHSKPIRHNNHLAEEVKRTLI